MIRFFRFLPLIALVSFFGCATTAAIYSSSTAVAPGAEEGQYEVVIKLYDISGKEPKTVGAPKKLIIYKGGEEGKAAELNKGRMMIYSAIAEEVGGQTQVKARVRVEDQGQAVWENEEKKNLPR